MNEKVERRTLAKVEKPKTVAEYITLQIQLCGKKQSEIAEIAGFPKANIISMIKNGDKPNGTPLPIAKIPGMAKALGVDKVHLLRLCMQQYEPEKWVILEGILGQTPLSEGEMTFINAIRNAGMADVRLRQEDIPAFEEFLKSLKSDNT